MSAADVDGQDEQTDGHPGSDVDSVSVRGPDHGEDDHEELEEGHGHDDKVDGCGMNLFVDFNEYLHRDEVIFPLDMKLYVLYLLFF